MLTTIRFRLLWITVSTLGVMACRSTLVVAGRANDGGPGDSGLPDGGSPGGSVLQHHNHASRDGLYVEPALTKAAAAGMHLDASFSAMVQGKVYAQPLYLSGGGSGQSLLFV